jgi:hypothetical protein
VFVNFCQKNENSEHVLMLKKTHLTLFFEQSLYQIPRSIIQVITLSKETGPLGITLKPQLFDFFLGAVANGRAKFEATPKGPEKPSRFFGSRSRTNSPMLPVKTPKVPDLKAKDSKANNEISEINSKKENNSNGGTEVDKKDKTASKPATLNLVNFSSNKLLSKMKK